MPQVRLSKEMRLLSKKWTQNTGWPKRLEWLEIKGLRGWSGQPRIDFSFPIVAIAGENGSGKSTIIQAAAAIYAPPEGRKGWYAYEFFPETAWDHITNASIIAGMREGDGGTVQSSVRKPGDRWRGSPDRRVRPVEYIDLRRTQPVSARTGYLRLAKSTLAEIDANKFDELDVVRLSEIMGHKYTTARLAITNADANRQVPVILQSGNDISGFHLGAGELAVLELLSEIKPPKYSLILIDEIETSLHPRAQRRLLRDLATKCRNQEWQIILTTHSPYILSELPPEGRGYIFRGEERKKVVFGVSPNFAMTKMDEEVHPDCDLYVEDERAEYMLREILVTRVRDNISRIQIIPYGTASVGEALGQIVLNNKFPRPSLVFLDGDQEVAPGCLVLPGGDAPERVVFEDLQKAQWGEVNTRIGRTYAELVDACNRAMTTNDHHEWVDLAANPLALGTDVLWQAMCAEWAYRCLDKHHIDSLIESILDVLP
jgi:predicted ATPase